MRGPMLLGLFWVCLIASTGCGGKDDPPAKADTGVDSAPPCIAFNAGPPAGTIPDGGADAADASDDARADAGRRRDAGPPDTGPSVPRNEIDDIWKRSCSFSSCHGRAPGSGGLFIPLRTESDWYPNVVGKPSTTHSKMLLVKPGDPTNSWVVHKIVGDLCAFKKDCTGPGAGKPTDPSPCGDRMPQGSPPLEAEDVAKIINWIRLGALEN